MFRTNRLFTILLLAALVFSACQPIQAPATSTRAAPAKGYTLVGLTQDEPRRERWARPPGGGQPIFPLRNTLYPPPGGLAPCVLRKS